jgi:hypothetical protein
MAGAETIIKDLKYVQRQLQKALKDAQLLELAPPEPWMIEAARQEAVALPGQGPLLPDETTDAQVMHIAVMVASFKLNAALAELDTALRSPDR